MSERPDELWVFSVATESSVDSVSLVTESDSGVSDWVEMARDRNGQWSAQRRFPRGGYRVRYFTQEGSTIINCGGHGLSARRLEGNAGVSVEPDHVAMNA